MSKHSNGNHKNSQTQSKRGSHRGLIIGSVIGLTIVLGSIVTLLCVSIAKQKQSEEQQLAQQAELNKKIEQCTKETKKDMLGFISYCYEDNNVDVPEDVLLKDKERANRILAQANYDLCMANALLKYAEVWDLNDINPQNGDTNDGLPTHLAELTQKDYDQQVDKCKSSHTLLGSYEDGFKTNYKKELVGWAEPKSDRIAIINHYNADGIIAEGSNVREDADLSDNVASVGGKAAQKFKSEHQELWY